MARSFKVVPEEIARISALRSGDVQIAFNLSINQANSLSNEPGFRVLEQSTSRVAVLNFNPAAAPADKLEFRKAVAAAVNKDELQKGLIKGLGQSASSIFAPAIQNVPTDAPLGSAYKPDDARKLIEAAGLKGAAVEIGGPSGRFPLDRELVSAVAAQLRRAGLDAKARTTEFGTYVSDIKAGRASPVFLQVQGNAWFDPVPQLDAFYLSGGLGSPWRDQAMDGLLAKTYEATTDAERATAVAGVVKRLNDDVMSVPLFSYTYLHGATAKVGWKPRPDEFIFAFELT
jgi:peptide/nickel transport system substrate-binding protein